MSYLEGHYARMADITFDLWRNERAELQAMRKDEDISDLAFEVKTNRVEELEANYNWYKEQRDMENV